ncbi:kinase-like domain-containing protein [Rhizoctonia solani]|nr:kinase-like domain-containing protein [Rhizoctonia solani]
MASFACPSPDDLFRNVCDLTSSTKIIGTKPFAYGGYSDIWRGIEWGAEATRDVAIKIIRVATRQDASLDRLKKRISREIITWRAVAHQNILPFYGLCWVEGHGPDGLPAMVYPYCEAGDCVHYLKNNADADRITILRQVADGLNHLHSCNPPIAHGDLKAANILMKQDGTPLIADFGLSRLVIEFSTGLTTSSSKGSFRWMAPELFGGINQQVIVLVTTASDVWAFGCLCIEILLGILPWASTRVDAAIMMAVVGGRQTPPLPESTATTAIGHIMSHCWTYEPAQRPSMVQLVNALVEMDPEHLHTSACVLLPPNVFSDSPPAILNSDSDSFTRTFSDSL